MPPRHHRHRLRALAQSAAAAAAAAGAWTLRGAERPIAELPAAAIQDDFLRHRAAAAVVDALEPAAGETPVLLRRHAVAPPAAAADVQWRC